MLREGEEMYDKDHLSCDIGDEEIPVLEERGGERKYTIKEAIAKEMTPQHQTMNENQEFIVHAIPLRS